MDRSTGRSSILKNAFHNLCKKLGYFGDNSSIHGVRHIISMSYIPVYKRIFWLIILTASGVCASAVLRQVMSLYSGGAVSYLVETNFLEFDTPFPAVTVCEQTNSERVKTYINQHKLPSTMALFFKDITFWNVKYCKTCPTCTNTTCMHDFYNTAREMRAQCTDLLSDCWWHDKPFKCCERFLPIETEYGPCFVFNSRLTSDKSSITINRRTGLPTLVFLAIDEVGIRIHSPDDMVSVGMENILGRPLVLPLITEFEVILKAEQTISDQSVSAMTPAVRGCLYDHESPSFGTAWPFKRYSYSTCMLFCRVIAQLDLCNCTHHLMPPMRDIPVCNIQGLACLNKNKESLGSVSCVCPMSCEEVNYKMVHMFLSRHSGKVSKELQERGTRGKVTLSQLPAFRVRRDAIRQMLGLVVDIGGVGGVFFGASVLNALEIIYLFCIRRV